MRALFLLATAATAFQPKTTQKPTTKLQAKVGDALGAGRQRFCCGLAPLDPPAPGTEFMHPLLLSGAAKTLREAGAAAIVVDDPVACDAVAGDLEAALDHYVNAESYYELWRDGEQQIERLKKAIAEKAGAAGGGTAGVGGGASPRPEVAEEEPPFMLCRYSAGAAAPARPCRSRRRRARRRRRPTRRRPARLVLARPRRGSPRPAWPSRAS